MIHSLLGHEQYFCVYVYVEKKVELDENKIKVIMEVEIHCESSR